MLNIDSKTNKITIINGDTGFIHLVVDNYKLVLGDVVRFTVKSNIYDNEEVIAKDYTDFLEDGSCIIEFESQDTRDLDAGTYYYDVQVSLSDGRVDTIIGPCKLVINKGVTERY